MIPAVAPAPGRRADRRPAGLAPALAAIVIVFAAKHAVTALVFPPFSGHDEVAHYGYVRTVALEGRVPRLSDPLPAEASAYRPYALDWSKGPGYQYAAVHPPLYYAAMAPLVAARPGGSPESHVYAIRLAGIWVGIATVLLAFALAREIFPGDGFMQVTTPTLVALQPQVSYEAAIVNNDALGIAATGLVLWLLARAMRRSFSPSSSFALGTALGVALLAKTTAVILAPAAALALWLAAAGASRRLAAVALICAPAIALSAPWYLFVYRTYGDLTGLARLAELQHTWNRSLGSFPELLFNTSFLLERFKETWGEFGWRRVPLDPALLWSLGIAALMAAAGLTRWGLTAAGLARPAHRDERPDTFAAQAILVLLCACVVAYLAVVQFGTRFALTQARYFFPVANAAAVLVALGFRELTPRRHRPVVQALLFVGLALLNAVIFTRAVIPAWYFPK